jgi:hypothetical protein
LEGEEGCIDPSFINLLPAGLIQVKTNSARRCELNETMTLGKHRFLTMLCLDHALLRMMKWKVQEADERCAGCAQIKRFQGGT